ncbi:hypothetical protein ACQY1Q_07485 [Tenacibaculum sp. TC6]|uniref:hypothetical protein n=1 Tax=Tenacibaculum sp. TC6 TaxID=3423223 RepID=UPI003D36445E
MIRVIVYLTVFIVSTFFSILFAQNKVETPCSSIEYSQFDFWVGKWKVYNDTGKLIGNNTVVKMPNACAIQENWTSETSKSKGTSYNYFDKKDNSWHQVWIDNGGGSLVLKGKFEKGVMVLMSDFVQDKIQKYRNKISWQLNKDKSVTQEWVWVDEKGKEIKKLFKGIYKK